MPIGMPSAGTRRAVVLNSVEYVIVGDVTTRTRPTTAERTYELVAWSGGVGARNAQQAGWPRPNMVYDATADTSKPGGITPPLLISTGTQAGTPTQTGRIYAMAEMGGVLNAFSLGSVTGPSTRHLRWEWDGATTTWTRNEMVAASTLSVGKNVAYIAGNLVVGQRPTGASDFASHRYSTDGTNFTGYADSTIRQNVDWLSNFGTSATGYMLLGDQGLYSFTIGGNLTLVLATVYPTTETVKTFFSWRNASAVDVLYILTDKHLRQSNSTPNAFSILLNITGADGNYALPLGAFMYLAYGDKGGVREYQWDANGGLVSVEGGLDLADGLPSDRTGPVTYLTESEGYLYAVVSGDDASSKTAVYKRRWPFTTAEGWHSVYKAATANQSSAVIAVSSADNSVTRLHIAQENASTTDFLYYVAMSGTLSYENGGFVTGPEQVFSDTRGASAVTEATVYADGLSADETITLAFDKDGAGSFTDFGAFTSSVLTLPATPDAAVTMNRGIPRLTFARGGTATNKATLRKLTYKVLVKTGILLEHTFVVDLHRSMQTSTNVTIDGVRTALQALIKTGGLQTFQADNDLDSTSRRVYVVSVETPRESLARGLGGIIMRRDLARYARVTITEAIGS